MTVFLLVLSTWVLIGAIAGLYEARRGHWSWLWLLGAMAGPMVVPLARQLQRAESDALPIELHGTSRSPGGLRVLAGIDGSAASVAAARHAVDLLGCRLGELVLAAVVDYEAQIDPSGSLAPPHPRDAGARRTLEAARAELGAWLGFEPTTVLLAGRPADALRSHAEESGFDLVVVGSRGRGLTKRLLGSCASDMAKDARVPALLMPLMPHPQLEIVDPVRATRPRRVSRLSSLDVGPRPSSSRGWRESRVPHLWLSPGPRRPRRHPRWHLRLRRPRRRGARGRSSL